MEELSLITLLLLGLVGIAAGFFDTLAGGGGLITVPVLMTTGLPPSVALGTNKLQGCIGELVASIRFLKHKKINLKDLRNGLIYTAIGTLVGTILVQIINPNILQKIIPFFMLAILGYTMAVPYLPKKSAYPKLSEKHFYLTCGLGIGFYNGFFGPGTGALWMFAFMFLLKQNITSATMHTKPLNFIGNFGSLILFMLAGKVAYTIAIVMSVGQIIGAHIGSHFVMGKGAKYIRPIFLLVVGIMTIKLFIDAFTI